MWVASCLVVGQVGVAGDFAPSLLPPHVLSTVPFEQGYEGFDAAVMVYMGAPLAIFAGVSVANIRALRLHRLPVDGALTAYDVELKARYCLHAALWGRECDLGCTCVALSPEHHPHSRADPFEQNGRIGAHRALKDQGDIENADGAAAAEALDGYSTTDAVMDVVQRMLTARDLNVVQEIFGKGCEKFNKSAIMQVFVARFHHVCSRNKHLHMR